MKYLPNILSTFRLALVPVFIIVFLVDYPKNVLWALFVFLLAGATDVVDGYIARKYKCISALGKILDPLADKLMQIAVLVCLCIKGVISIWLPIIIVTKEIAIMVCGAIIIRWKKVYVVSSWYGKAAVCIFYLGICYFMLRPMFNLPSTVVADIYITSAVMAVSAILAFVMYIDKYRKQLLKTDNAVSGAVVAEEK